MADKQALESIEWIEKRLQQIQLTIKALEQAPLCQDSCHF
jgi:hypothetical protein